MANNPFLGTWRLISYRAVDESGTTMYPMGPDAEGLIMYTADGYMSVHIQEAGRAAFGRDNIRAGTPEEYASAARSYLAYAGAYEVLPEEILHVIRFSLFPNWVGTTLKRFYRFEDNRLTLSTAPIDTGRRRVTLTLVWERAGS